MNLNNSFHFNECFKYEYQPEEISTLSETLTSNMQVSLLNLHSDLSNNTKIWCLHTYNIGSMIIITIDVLKGTKYNFQIKKQT